MQAERNVRTGILQVVALDTFVHDSESAANHSFTTASEVVSEAETRTERRPVIVHEAFWYAVLSGNPNSVQVKLLSYDRIRTGTQTWTGSIDCAVWIEHCLLGWIVERGIEVAHAVVGFISVRYAVPAQTKVQG